MRTRSPILPVHLALLAVGVVDLLTTLLWVDGGHAIEANPVMAWVLKGGYLAFAAVKLSTLAAYVSVMEWYRRRRSARIAQGVGVFTVSAYASIYALCFAVVNQPHFLG